MKVIYFSEPCSHTNHIIDVGSYEEAQEISKSLIGTLCKTCGSKIEGFKLCIRESEHKKFQENEKSRLTPRISKDFSKDFKKKDKALAEQCLIEHGGLPNHEMLIDIQKAVLEKTPSHLNTSLSLIPLGLYSSYTLNAMKISYEGLTIPVIIVHWGLPSYIFFMNRIVVSFLTVTYIGEEEKTGNVSEKATIKHKEAIKMAYGALERLYANNPKPPRLPESSDMQKKVEYGLTRSMEMFVLSHEYGHAVLGHEGSTRNNEFEADIWAQDLLAGRLNNSHRSSETDTLHGFMNDPSISHAAPLIFFIYEKFHLLYKASKPSTPSGIDTRLFNKAINLSAYDETHPTPEERFKKMSEYISKYGHWQAKSLVIETLNIVDSIAQSLFGKSLEMNY